MFPLIGREINTSKKENIKKISINDDLFYLILAPKGFSQIISRIKLIMDFNYFEDFLKQIMNKVGIKSNISLYPSIRIEINKKQFISESNLRQRYILEKDNFKKIDEDNIQYILAKNNLDLYYNYQINDNMVPNWLANRFWNNITEFKNNAYPIIITKDKKMICVCYSAANFYNHAEVDILTLDEYRKIGLASICASKFIENVLNKDIIPLWDAFLANPASCRLAEKFGYSKISKPYNFYRTYWN